MLDRLALSATSVARNLYLLENSRRKHVLLDLHTMAMTHVTSIDLAIFTSSPVALVADLLLLQLELGGMPIVKVLQRNADSYFHVWSSPLTLLMPKVSTTTEEPREHVKWIMVSASLALLPLF
tara:strand:+ start:1188 stop:1556 length:369 start_codon:yes stop_codon:yes gene_type:complete